MLLSLLDLKELIRTVPDFPQKGVDFKDIMPLLKDAEAFQSVLLHMSDKVKNQQFDYIAGIEARGFILGAPLANELDVGFLALRKQGKLPGKVATESYSLEYGEASLEIQNDAIKPNSKVLIVDDVLATGGTAQCAANLIEKLGGEIVGFLFLATIDFLNGKEKIAKYKQQSLLAYD